MITQEKRFTRALKRSHTSTTSASSSSSKSTSPSSLSWIHLRSILLVVASSSSSPVSYSSTDRGSIKSPWSRRKRKHVLLPKQWNSLFKSDGRFIDDGLKFFKKVRSGGVDPSIRAEVWPFLLGLYNINSSKEERDSIRTQKRKEYQSLRKQCRLKLKLSNASFKLKESAGNSSSEGSVESSQLIDFPLSIDSNHDLSEHSNHDTPEDPNHSKPNDSNNDTPEDSDHSEPEDSNTIFHDSSLRLSSNPHIAIIQLESSAADSDHRIHNPTLSSDLLLGADEKNGLTCQTAEDIEFDSSDSDCIEDTDLINGKDLNDLVAESSSPTKMGNTSKSYTDEDFTTWQRIIRLDAVRANAEWIIYSPSQASVSEVKAHRLAESVGLKDYDHLEPCRIFHAARLVSILEAYALYDSEIGYCQGMSDLLSPIISTLDKDDEAFWCFVGFMKKARHNFRLDEIGIRRQLSIVSKIIKCKDSHLYKHLEKLQAEDCFFVYRMVVVLFRRELTFEQTLCLWEVMWADQAAIRAGISKSVWGKIRLKAPPTDDLLLYAIAACVLQKRKLIIEKYNNMEDIMRECNGMAGHLDVWKLLDDAHDLVVNLHDKI